MPLDGERHEPNEPQSVRRQVELVVRCVIDVPAHMDEEAVRFLVEEHSCNSDLIMSLAEQIAHDDEKGACNVCFLSQARLVPVTDEIKSAWLSGLPQPMAGFHPGGDEEEEVEESEDEEDEDALDDEDEEDDAEEPTPEPSK